jgi:hypothetical protein
MEKVLTNHFLWMGKACHFYTEEVGKGWEFPRLTPLDFKNSALLNLGFLKPRRTDPPCGSDPAIKCKSARHHWEAVLFPKFGDKNGRSVYIWF